MGESRSDPGEILAPDRNKKTILSARKSAKEKPSEMLTILLNNDIFSPKNGPIAVVLLLPWSFQKLRILPMFQGVSRAIGKSFQPAINAPQQSFTGHVIASAQS